MNIKFKRPKLLVLAVLMLFLLGTSAAIAENVSSDSPILASDHSVDAANNTAATPALTGTDIEGTNNAVTTDTDSAADQSDSVDTADNSSTSTAPDTDVDGIDNAETTDTDSTADQTQPVDTANNIEETTALDNVVVTENTPPVANDQSVVTEENTAIDITMTSSDADNDELTFLIIAGPQNGTMNANGSTVTYTPNDGYVGDDSFTFIVNDGKTDSNIASVSISVTAIELIDTWEILNENNTEDENLYADCPQ